MSSERDKMHHERIHFSAEDDPWEGDPLRGTGWRFVHRSRSWRPPTDVLETDDSFVVVIELAGMRGLDISVTFERGILSVSGSRPDTNVRTAYHQIEIDYGEFASNVNISSPIDTDAIEATYVDGFLRIHLPKASPRSVTIDE